MNMKSNLNWNTILVVAGVDILQVVLRQGVFFTMWNVIAGIILACLLAAVKLGPDANLQELAVLSTVWGLTLVLVLSVPLQKLSNPDSQDVFFFFIWGMMTIAAYLGLSLQSRNRTAQNSGQATPGINPEPVKRVDGDNLPQD
ncbi:MAG: hypothetical protein JO316_20235 [Abitibacteriaceae bacterium]|nr:hypothetical protein [Abditibacteriaceae bacterium]